MKDPRDSPFAGDKTIEELVKGVDAYKERHGYEVCGYRHDDCIQPESLHNGHGCSKEVGMECTFYIPYFLLNKNVGYAIKPRNEQNENEKNETED